ncbi:hypothetical protein [Muricoccus radiodurans]|uniref:hypothetical protein n=1 Tax=Muricoccus radiodurans TaxID=2231721 RepID=UPI003CEA4CB8
MALHKFVVGQDIEVRPGKFDTHIPRGTYTVVRLLPGESHDREYRLKHVGDGHERVMRESQLLDAA